MESAGISYRNYQMSSLTFDHPKAIQGYVFIVYFANIMCGIEDKKYFYDFIEDDVLARFNLQSLTRCEKIHEEIKQSYNELQE